MQPQNLQIIASDNQNDLVCKIEKRSYKLTELDPKNLFEKFNKLQIKKIKEKIELIDVQSKNEKFIFNLILQLQCQYNEALKAGQTNSAIFKKIVSVLDSFIISDKKIKTQITQIKQIEPTFWHLDAYSNARQLDDQIISHIQEPIKVAKGAHQCKQCKSDRTYSYQQSLRSLDEASTTFITCANCNKRWTV